MFSEPPQKFLMIPLYIHPLSPPLALDKIERKFIDRSQEESNVSNIQGEPSEEDSNNPSNNNTGRDTTKDIYNKGHLVIPYEQGLGESIKNVCRKCEI